MKNLKPYVSDILESYKDTRVVILGNTGTVYFLLQIVQCRSACAVDDDNWSLPVVLYCSEIMYKYYSHIGFLLIKHDEEGNDIDKELFNSIPHFTKNSLHVNCIHDFFKCTMLMY